MRIRSLERVLGLQLLARTRTGSVLTPAGAATAEWSAAVLRDMRALLTGASALRREGRRRLHLAASMTVAEYLLPYWLGQLAVASPDVTVSLEMGNTARVAELVAARQVDVGFIEGDRPPGRLRAKNLLADELVVVVGRRHPWTRRHTPLTAVELAANPLLMREHGSGTRDVLTAALARQGLTAQALMELGSTTAIKAAAIAGSGPAVLSRLAVAAEVRSGELVPVLVEGLELGRTIRAIWASGRPLAGAAAQLVTIAEKAGANLDSSMTRP
jgi:DNA-binding transcriptional LysR family regulator